MKGLTCTFEASQQALRVREFQDFITAHSYI
jgi:hypothetical protein